MSLDYNISLSRLLGTEGPLPRERYQEPKLQQTKQGVWFIRPWVDVIIGGKVTRAKKTITIGAMGKREAQAKAREVMATINRADYVITSQIKFGKFLAEYLSLHVSRQAASTQEKYRSHIKNHIRPAFENLMLCEIDTLLVQKWLDAFKGSWNTKTDIRNILSSIYTKAIEWGRWKDRHPIEHVHVGRKTVVREHHKLSDDETRRLLAALPEDVRRMCCIALFCTLRVSEILGLQEKHLDFARGLILVRQRFWRGDLDDVKSVRSKRDVPMGYLAPELQSLCQGDPERFAFQIATRPEWGRKQGVCRDDRDILQHFLRPAAKSIGAYRPGFGWHSLRREAVTALGAILGPNAAQRMAGHATSQMTLHYTLADHLREDQAVRKLQERISGGNGGKLQ